jgi:predicted dehydrogenase
MKTVKFGIIGCGLMGREFASAASRWCHISGVDTKPEIVAVCDKNQDLFAWYREHIPTINQYTDDYRELLSNKDVEAVYCAVPHNLHGQIYVDILKAEKHLMGEKPFGMDIKQNNGIMKEIKKHPKLLVRCSSEFPYFPGAQRVIQSINENKFGTIIEVNAGFLHSSDINPKKPINWKRMIDINGEYGCMGDLGMHVFHIPLRAGWMPKRLYATLSNIVKERPDKSGKTVACETWDNAILHCEVESGDQVFPMTCKTYRIGPGETDTWYIEIKGTRHCARFTTKTPKTFYSLDYCDGGEQAWKQEDLGYGSVYKSITGGIFEFGFPDAILQMWASFLDELAGNEPPYRCATPEENAQSHQIFTAALKSQDEKCVVELNF